MTLNRRNLIIGAAALSVAAPLPAQAQNPDIYGQFQVEGMNRDGTRYSGTVSVEATGPGRVTVRWNIGASAYGGEGIVEGRVMAVDWNDRAPAVYVIMPFGELHGTWDNGRAVERWFRG